MTNSWRQSAFLHAHKCHPHECCGMIIQTKEKTFYGPCKNLVKDNPEYQARGIIRISKEGKSDARPSAVIDPAKPEIFALEVNNGPVS